MLILFIVMQVQSECESNNLVATNQIIYKLLATNHKKTTRHSLSLSLYHKASFQLSSHTPIYNFYLFTLPTQYTIFFRLCSKLNPSLYPRCVVSVCWKPRDCRTLNLVCMCLFLILICLLFDRLWNFRCWLYIFLIKYWRVSLSLVLAHALA